MGHCYFIAGPLHRVSFNRLFTRSLIIIIRLNNHTSLLLQFTINHSSTRIILLRGTISSIIQQGPPSNLHISQSTRRQALHPPQNHSNRPQVTCPNCSLPYSASQDRPFMAHHRNIRLPNKETLHNNKQYRMLSRVHRTTRILPIKNQDLGGVHGRFVSSLKSRLTLSLKRRPHKFMVLRDHRHPIRQRFFIRHVHRTRLSNSQGTIRRHMIINQGQQNHQRMINSLTLRNRITTLLSLRRTNTTNRRIGRYINRHQARSQHSRHNIIKRVNRTRNLNIKQGQDAQGQVFSNRTTTHRRNNTGNHSYRFCLRTRGLSFCSNSRPIVFDTLHQAVQKKSSTIDSLQYPTP